MVFLQCSQDLGRKMTYIKRLVSAIALFNHEVGTLDKATCNPTSQFTARVEAGSVDYEDRELGGVISGLLAGSLASRLAV